MKFNSLHCGAVVASWRAEARAAQEAAGSIPFIAGQWSLPWRRRRAPGRRSTRSIPFIAGQWSLPRDAEEQARKAEAFNSLHCGAVVASPFYGAGLTDPVDGVFNSLHCGAVVAS